MKANILNLIAISTLLLGLPANAKTVQDVNFEDKKTVNGQELVLNGVGIRKATFFRVKVYVSGLYLKSKESDAKKIHQQKGLKKIEMQFLMGVDRSKLTNAWQESLSQHCPEDCDELKKGLAKMNSYMKNVSKKDRFEFILHPDKVEVFIKGEKKEDIVGKSFSAALLKVFVGPKEIDEGMAKGLRGI